MKKFVFLLFFVNVFFTQAQHFVSVSGTAAGDGSMARPWDLQTALNHPPSVKPGDTLYLLGGRYFPPRRDTSMLAGFISYLKGSKEKPIVVTPYQQDRVIIDGANLPHPVESDVESSAFGALGAYTDFVGLEITNSREGFRVSANIRRALRVKSVIQNAVGLRWINNVIHNTGEGLGVFSACQDCELYGNIIFYNGWSHTGVRGHGEGMYLQNSANERRVADNIIFRQFDSGMIIYGTSNSKIDSFLIEGNVLFDNGSLNDDPNGWGFLFGKNSTLTGPGKHYRIQHNYLYNSLDYRRSNNIDLGYQSGLDQVEFHHNYSVGYQAIRYNIPVTNLNSSHNTLVGGIGDVSRPQMEAGINNRIFSGQQKPDKNEIFIRNNDYEKGRSHVIVYNWERKNSVSIPLDQTGLSLGQDFEVYDVQNLLSGPLYRSRYTDINQLIDLPMDLLQVSLAIGNIPRTPVHTDLEFGVFLIKAVPGTSQTKTLHPDEKYTLEYSGDHVILRFSSLDPKKAYLLDMNGLSVGNLDFMNGEIKIQKNLLASGLYFLVLEKDSHRSVVKIFIP
ncbi:MAG TPA: hypothetical protein PKH94_10815 [Bacteroidales bacterium]|nr:hypothetical protein [Bacteroidales bacterium]